MHQDSTRNKLDFEMYCSKHPGQRLNFSTELSKIGASSAYEVNIKIVVHPCEICQNEVDSIKHAIGTLLSFQK